MTERLADLVARVRLDTSDLDKAPQRGRQAGAGIASGMAKGLAAAGGAAVIGAFFKSSIDAASDLAESTSKVGVVFGEAKSEVLDFARGTTESMGLSEQAALSYTGTLGNLFVALKLPQAEAAKMSTELVTLAADLASFNNVNVDDALNALRSGLVGETEPLRQFGVNLNEATIREKALALGLIKTAKDVIPASVKAQATYALILEQTATAQGDFARTSDGLANQTRIAQARLADVRAELGQRLIPAYLKLAEAANSALQFVADNPRLVDAAIAFGKIAVALVAVNKAIKIAKAIRASELVVTLAQVRASQTLLATETARAALPGGGVAGAGGAARGVAGKAGLLAGVAVGTYVAGDYARDAFVNVVEQRRKDDESGESADRARMAIRSANKFRDDAGFEARYQAEARPLIQKGEWDAAAQAIGKLTHEYALLTPAQRAAAAEQTKLSQAQAGSAPITQAQAEAYRSLRESLFASFDAFAERPDAKPMSSKQLLKRLGVNTEAAKQMALDIEDLIQKGVSLPAIEKLRELETSAPGTIRGIVKGGISGPFVDQINTDLGEAKYAESVIASLVTTGSRAALPAQVEGTKVAKNVTDAIDTELRRYRGGIPPIVVNVDTRSAMQKLADLKREIHLVSRLGDDPDNPYGKKRPNPPTGGGGGGTPTPADVGTTGGRLVNAGGAGWTP